MGRLQPQIETFDTVEERCLALHELRRQYNETWLMGRMDTKPLSKSDMSNVVLWLMQYNFRS
jgi:hypothetical protein